MAQSEIFKNLNNTELKKKSKYVLRFCNIHTISNLTKWGGGKFELFLKKIIISPPAPKLDKKSQTNPTQVTHNACIGLLFRILQGYPH